jgi:hypothetical protein
MATATIETRIANPARKAGKRMARKMSLKQKAAFGSKRVRAAAKAALSRQRKRKRNAPKAKHRPRTKPTAKRRRKRTNPPAPRRRRAVAAAPRKKRRRKNGSAKRKAKKRKNTGALYALVNPARKKGTSMARRKKNRRKSNPAGKRRAPRRTGKRMNRRRRNPGTMGSPMDWLSLGSGAIIGGLGATSIPQMVLGSSNTGPMGYLGMAASTAVLAVAVHFMFKKNMMLTSGIIAGGAGALIKRIIGDYTPFGQYLNASAGASGMGDYLSGFNFAVPQIIGGNGNTSLGTPGSIPVSVAGAGSGAGRALMNV